MKKKSKSDEGHYAVDATIYVSYEQFKNEMTKYFHNTISSISRLYPALSMSVRPRCQDILLSSELYVSIMFLLTRRGWGRRQNVHVVYNLILALEIAAGSIHCFSKGTISFRHYYKSQYQKHAHNRNNMQLPCSKCLPFCFNYIHETYRIKVWASLGFYVFLWQTGNFT